jgi:hypothetical protein
MQKGRPYPILQSAFIILHYTKNLAATGISCG